MRHGAGRSIWGSRECSVKRMHLTSQLEPVYSLDLHDIIFFLCFLTGVELQHCFQPGVVLGFHRSPQHVEPS